MRLQITIILLASVLDAASNDDSEHSGSLRRDSRESRRLSSASWSLSSFNSFSLSHSDESQSEDDHSSATVLQRERDGENLKLPPINTGLGTRQVPATLAKQHSDDVLPKVRSKAIIVKAETEPLLRERQPEQSVINQSQSPPSLALTESVPNGIAGNGRPTHAGRKVKEATVQHAVIVPKQPSQAKPSHSPRRTSGMIVASTQPSANASNSGKTGEANSLPASSISSEETASLSPYSDSPPTVENEQKAQTRYKTREELVNSLTRSHNPRGVINEADLVMPFDENEHKETPKRKSKSLRRKKSPVRRNRTLSEDSKESVDSDEAFHTAKTVTRKPQPPSEAVTNSPSPNVAARIVALVAQPTEAQKMISRKFQEHLKMAPKGLLIDQDAYWIKYDTLPEAPKANTYKARIRPETEQRSLEERWRSARWQASIAGKAEVAGRVVSSMVKDSLRAVNPMRLIFGNSGNVNEPKEAAVQRVKVNPLNESSIAPSVYRAYFWKQLPQLPQIVPLLDFAVIDPGKPMVVQDALQNVPLSQDSAFLFVTPFANGGTLRDALTRGEFGPFEEGQGEEAEKTIALVVNDIALGLLHMHNAGIVHHNLKPESVFIYRNTGSDGTVNSTFAIGGMDFIQNISVSEHVSVAVRGDPMYMAPEALALDMSDLNTYTGNALPHSYDVDLWSLGLIAYELYTGQPLYSDPFFVDCREYDAPQNEEEYLAQVGQYNEKVALFCMGGELESRIASFPSNLRKFLQKALVMNMGILGMRIEASAALKTPLCRLSPRNPHTKRKLERTEEQRRLMALIQQEMDNRAPIETGPTRKLPWMR